MILVIGGHTRNIGKTSAVCGVIRATPDLHWTAIKITQYGHSICSRDGQPCDCSDPVHPIAVTEEDGSRPSTDSGRFLDSGASRAFWVRTPAGQLHEAMPKLRRLLDASANVIIESNSVLRFLKPDLCAMVLDGSVPDFKTSSRRFLDRANVLLLTSAAPLAWPEIPAALLRHKPRYPAPPPAYANADFIEAIRNLALKPLASKADHVPR